MKRLFTLLVLFAVPIVIYAQDTWSSYTTADGLIGNLVSDVVIDHAGNKWFATDDGVSKFDGTTWTNYTFENTAYGLGGIRIKAMAEDHNGNMWFGSEDGISKFDGSNWTPYNSRTTSDGLPGYSINSIYVDSDNNVWFSTNGGVGLFDGTDLKTYDVSQAGWSDHYDYFVHIDAEGNKWFGPYNGGVGKFDGNAWTLYNTGNSGVSSNFVYNMIIDASNNKWFSTLTGGISKFDGTNWTVYNNANTGGGLPDDNVRSILIDAAGNKWVGTSGGLSKFDGSNWTPYTNSNTFGGLISDKILSMAMDQDGKIWIGTNAGVSVLTTAGALPLHLLSFTGINGPGGNILSWESINEDNHKGFDIESSTNGKNFTTIGFVSAANTVKNHTYSFTDGQPANGTVYYRLKMMAIDGGFEYSRVITIQNKLPSIGSSIYPNPVLRQLHLIVGEAGKSLRIFSIGGQELLEQKINTQKSVIDVSRLAPGIYLYRYGNETGKFLKK